MSQTQLGPMRYGWRPVSPPRRPVLFVNPRSGAGAAARAGIAQLARDRGIEAVTLEPSQTWQRSSTRRSQVARTRWGWQVAMAPWRSWQQSPQRVGFRSFASPPGHATTLRSISEWTGVIWSAPWTPSAME
jgi:hypothetical protein